MEVEIENIGGIREGRATLESGINAVRGLNWQGKSSFIQALETGMGTEMPLTEGEVEGGVSLETEDGRYDVTLKQRNGAVRRDGTPYLTEEYDQVCASLYAFLDDDNTIRAAVRDGQNLEELLTRPLDFEDIDARIGGLQTERRSVEAELERAKDAASELPGKRKKVERLGSELKELREEWERLGAEQEDDDVSTIAETREELSQARAERSRLQDRVDRLKKAINRAEEKLESVRTERDEIEVPSVDVETELSETRGELSRLERDLELIQGLYSANKQIVDEDRVDLLTGIEHGLIDDDLECWVCGSSTSVEIIEQGLSEMGEQMRSLKECAEDRRERIERLEEKRATAERAEHDRRDLDRQASDLESTIEDRRESLEGAAEQLADAEERIDELADEVADTDERLTDVQSEVKYLESQLADERDELAELEQDAEQTEGLKATLEEIRDELETLRQRKQTVKQRTREAFDEAISELVGKFETSFETARLTGNFDLVVARDGREASLDALSEGEVELLGLVAALAGYRAYDVADRTPLILLDGIGALADENLQTLIEYLSDSADYLVFTAYPEHTPFDGHQLDPSEWQVVSDDSNPEASA